MSQEMKTRREALKKGTAFVIPTITAFKLSSMAVACSGNPTNCIGGSWSDGWCADGDTKSWGGTWGTWDGWGGWGW